MANKKVDDWVVEIGFDTTKFDKAMKKVEKTLNKTLNTQVKVARQQAATSSKATKAMSKENRLLAQQNIFRRKIAQAEELGLGKTRMTESKNPVFIRKRILEIDKQIFAQRQKLKKQSESAAPVAASRGSKVLSVKGQSSAILGGESLDSRRAGMANRIRRSQEKALKVLGRQSKEYKEIAKSAALLNKQINSTVGVRNLQRLNESVRDFTTATNGATSASRKFNSQLKQQNFTTRSVANSTRNLAASYLSVFAALEGAKGITDTATRFDSLDASLLAASGNAEAAAADFEFIKQKAFEMGIGLETVTDGFRQIGTAQRFSGVEAGEAKKQFEQMLKVSRSFGLSSADTNLVLLAFQQMISKGTVSSEELRRQLGERLPGAVSVAAKALNVTGGELASMLKKGEVITTDFLPKFLSLYEKSVVESGAYAKSLKTITFAQSNLISQWQLMIKTMSDAVGKGVLIDLFNNMSKVVEGLAPKLEFLVRVFGGLAVGLTALFAGFLKGTAPIFEFMNFILSKTNEFFSLMTGGDVVVDTLEAIGVALGTIATVMGIIKVGAVVSAVGALLPKLMALLPVLSFIKNTMMAIAAYVGLSTGGVSLLAGAAVIGAGFGISALIDSGSSSGATTVNNTNTITVNTPHDEVRDVVSDLFEGMTGQAGVAGG